MVTNFCSNLKLSKNITLGDLHRLQRLALLVERTKETHRDSIKKLISLFELK